VGSLICHIHLDVSHGLVDITCACDGLLGLSYNDIEERIENDINTVVCCKWQHQLLTDLLSVETMGRTGVVPPLTEILYSCLSVCCASVL